MKNECNIIKDLLPLYAENMVSSDTAAFVEEHLKSCAECRREYEGTKEPQAIEAASHTAPLLQLSKRLRAKKIETIALTAAFVAALLVSAFAVLDAPIYLPYSEELISVEPVEDGALRITFDEAVTDFDCTVYPDPDGGDFCRCEVQAWTSLWDILLLKGKEELSTTVFPTERSVAVEYLPNDGSENIHVYGDASGDRTVAMPRLALGYYLIAAAAALLVLGVAWLAAKRNERARVVIERVGLYPPAYIAAHFIVTGIDWSSYSMPRDLSLIVFISVLLYSGLLLAHNILRVKREVKEINR